MSEKVRIRDGGPVQYINARTWLAGLAMEAQIAALWDCSDPPRPHSKEDVAGHAVDYADALLYELEKPR